MAKHSATPIMLAEGQRTVHCKIECREKITQQQIRRAKEIWLAAQQLSTCDIAGRWHITLQTVHRW